MSDLAAVIQTIAQNLVTPIYPNGTTNPSIAGVQVTINDGWPIRSQLDADLQSGFAHVSVYPTNQERVMTKFERVYELNTQTPTTIVLTVSGTSVTVTGTISTPQVVMIIANSIGYAYAIQSNDTVNTIATNTAALIEGATATGNVLTIPSAYSLKAVVSTPYSASQEIARMDRVVMISVWAPNQVIRATLEAAIDVYMKENYRIPMPDNFFAQVFYLSMSWTDQLEKSLIYRSDLKYTIQYATTITNAFMSVADAFPNSITLQPNQ